MIEALKALRNDGWSVAVHNDYQQDGEPFTFWLLTHPDGHYVKGEGRTDTEALDHCFAQAAQILLRTDWKGLAEMLKRERDGEVWVWQRDGGNEIESLACPVLIQAHDLRALGALREPDLYCVQLTDPTAELYPDGHVPWYPSRKEAEGEVDDCLKSRHADWVADVEAGLGDSDEPKREDYEVEPLWIGNPFSTAPATAEAEPLDICTDPTHLLRRAEPDALAGAIQLLERAAADADAKSEWDDRKVEHGASLKRKATGYRAAAARLRNSLRKKTPCTGIAASWCPNCGDCTTKDKAESGRCTDRLCPLHGDDSAHGESTVDPPYIHRAEDGPGDPVAQGSDDLQAWFDGTKQTKQVMAETNPTWLGTTELDGMMTQEEWDRLRPILTNIVVDKIGDIDVGTMDSFRVHTLAMEVAKVGIEGLRVIRIDPPRTEEDDA